MCNFYVHVFNKNFTIYRISSKYGTPLFLGPWKISYDKSHLMVVSIISIKAPYYDLLQANGILNMNLHDINCALTQDFPYFLC